MGINNLHSFTCSKPEYKKYFQEKETFALLWDDSTSTDPAERTWRFGELNGSKLADKTKRGGIDTVAYWVNPSLTRSKENAPKWECKRTGQVEWGVWTDLHGHQVSNWSIGRPVLTLKAPLDESGRPVPQDFRDFLVTDKLDFLYLFGEDSGRLVNTQEVLWAPRSWIPGERAMHMVMIYKSTQKSNDEEKIGQSKYFVDFLMDYHLKYSTELRNGPGSAYKIHELGC